MKLLFDLFPVILFFVVYKLGGSYPHEAGQLASGWLGGLVASGQVADAQAPILLATAVAIVASLAQVGWLLARGRRIEPMLWVSLAVIVVFGGATIWLNDETFIKWKPSILYLLFAGSLVAGRLFWQRNFVRTLLGKQIELPPPPLTLRSMKASDSPSPRPWRRERRSSPPMSPRCPRWARTAVNTPIRTAFRRSPPD